MSASEIETPRLSVRSMITADALASGWVMAYENSASSGYVREGMLLVVLWTGDDDLVAATLSGGRAPMPEHMAVVPTGDTAAAQSIVLGWLHGRSEDRPEIMLIGSAPTVVAGIDAEMARAIREQYRR